MIVDEIIESFEGLQAAKILQNPLLKPRSFISRNVSFSRNKRQGNKEDKKGRLFHECMSSLLLSKTRSIRNYAAPDTFQFADLTQLQPENLSIDTLIRARVRKRSTRFFVLVATNIRKKGKERGWNGNHLRSAATFRRGGLNKQLVIRPSHIYGNKGTSRKLARGRVFGFFRVQPRNSMHDFKAWS